MIRLSDAWLARRAPRRTQRAVLPASLQPYAHACQAMPGQPCKDCLYQLGAYKIIEGAAYAIYARFAHRHGAVACCRDYHPALTLHKQRKGLYLCLLSVSLVGLLLDLPTPHSRLFARLFAATCRDTIPALASVLDRMVERAEARYGHG